MSPISLALEATLVALLAACLLYCWRLDRKLSALRTGQDGMLRAAQELSQAVSGAEAAIRGLRKTADEAGRDLQARIDDARAIADRLGIDAGRMRSRTDATRLGRNFSGGA